MIRLYKMGLLIIALLINMQVNAQVKKPIVKAKTITALPKVVAINKINLFDLSADEATETLSNELKKLSIVLEDIEEYQTYNYDENGKKLNTINNTVKKLIFNKGLTSFIATNNIDVIKEISFVINDAKYNRSIKTLLGYNNWQAVFQSENDTTFKSGYFIVNTNKNSVEDETGKKTGEHFSIAMKQITPYTYKPSKVNDFIPKTLTVHDNADDVGYSIVELMKKQGLIFLYKSDIYSLTDDNKFLNYNTTYHFANGISLDINTNVKNKLLNISFNLNNPLAFIKLKKEFKILEFEHTGNDTENNIEYYKYNNISSTIFPKQKAIIFYISPAVEDIKTRYQNTAAISGEDLVNMYLKNDSSILKNIIAQNYVNKVDIDWKSRKMTYNEKENDFDFLFKSPSDSISFVSYEYKLSNTWSRIIYFSTRDKVYYEKMKTELTQIANKPESEISINFSDIPYAATGMQYISIFSKAQEQKVQENKRLLAQQREQERQELLARQQQQREEQAERDRLKAEKAAKSAADIQRVGDALLKGLQDIQRAKKGGG